MSVEFRLLGDIEVRIAGTPVEVGHSRQRCVLAALAIEVNRPVPAEQLLDRVWGDRPPHRARNVLSGYLSRLRHVLVGADGVQISRQPGGYVLAADPLSIDVHRFHQLVVEARGTGDAGTAATLLNQALELWRGEALATLDTPWLNTVRDALAAERHTAELDRNDLALAAGRHTDVLGEIAAGVGAYPLDERLAGQLMLALYRCGRQADALAAYQDVRHRLVEELGADPGPALRRLFEQILRCDAALDTPPPPVGSAGHGLEAPPPIRPVPAPAALTTRDPWPFVGRNVKLRRLAALLGTSAHLVAITGEPGIGKTRLATEFGRAAHLAGGTVLYGRCDDEQIVPYQPVVEALRHVVAAMPGEELGRLLGGSARDLALLVPELTGRLPDVEPRSVTAPEEIQRYRLFEAIAALLAAVPRPAVLLVDDAHWADRSTVSLLRHLLRRPGEGTPLVVVTYRDGEVPPEHALTGLLADLHRDERVTWMPLGGLSGADLAGLLNRADLAAEVHRLTDGNPFFARQLARHLDETGATDLAEAGIPPAVGGVLDRRLARLSPAAQRGLTIACVAGRRFDLAPTAAAAELSGDELLDALEEAAAARLVGEVPGVVGSFAFVHDLVRETFYDRLSGTRRARIHRRLGEALEDAPAVPAAELARHFCAAADPAVAAKAVQHAVRAAEAAAAQLAHGEAAGYYQQALAALALMADPPSGRRGELQLALGQAAARAGDPAAREAFLAAADTARDAADATLLAAAALGLSGQWGWTGAIDQDRVDLLFEALAALDPGPSELRARVLARLAGELHDEPGRARAVELSDQAVQVARQVGNPAALAACLESHSRAVWGPGGVERRWAVGEEIVRLGGAAGDHALVLSGRAWKLTAATESMDLAALDRELHCYMALADELREPRYVWYAATRRAMRAYAVGDFDVGERVSAQARSLGEGASIPEAIRVWVVGNCPLWRERPEPHARMHIENNLKRQRATLPDAHPQRVLWPAAMTVLYLCWDDETAARALYDAFPVDVVQALPRDEWWLNNLAFLAETAARLRDTDLVEVLHELLEPYGGDGVVTGGAAVFWGAVAHWRGVLAAALDQWDLAERHLVDALGAHERMGARPWVARSRLELARVLRARGRPGDHGRAAGLLAQAGQTANELAMRVLAADLAALG